MKYKNKIKILFLSTGKSLLWVGVLGLFVLYIFTLVAFGLLRSSLDPEIRKKKKKIK